MATFNGVPPAMAPGLPSDRMAHAAATRKSVAVPVISSAVQVSDDGSARTCSKASPTAMRWAATYPDPSRGPHGVSP
jgi:hypothetical protein